MSAAGTRVPWSRDELIVVCGLYFTLPFGQMHARNPRIIETARHLGRTPSSIAMKLVNFASLDPAHHARGVKGLGGHSRADEHMWKEFRENWDQMMILSETTLQRFSQGDTGARFVPTTADEPIVVADNSITEAEAIVTVRTVQSVFRKIVFAAYHSICCISGNPVPELLVASHILPWCDFPEQRLNPRNGLCLAAHFDRAFDRGLITFDCHMRLLLSPVLREHLPNDAIQTEFVAREGRPIRCPDRFMPDSEFLTYHRERLFRA